VDAAGGHARALTGKGDIRCPPSYGPQKALFDKTWRLPGIERLAAQ
jgi:hypothetical protein